MKANPSCRYGEQLIKFGYVLSVFNTVGDNPQGEGFRFGNGVGTAGPVRQYTWKL